MRPILVRKQPATAVERRNAKLLCFEYAISVCHRRISSFSPLSERKESQVYLLRLENGGDIVIKRHTKREAFINELVALTMFRDFPFSPALIGTPPIDESILAMEFLSSSFSVKTKSDISEAARNLAILHEFAALCFAKLDVSVQNKAADLSDLLARSDTACLKTIIQESIEIFGPDYHPVAIGDIKREHLRSRGTTCVFIDMETFGWGQLELLDLFALCSLNLGKLGFELRAGYVSEAYCSARCAHDGIWASRPQVLSRWLSQLRNG